MKKFINLLSDELRRARVFYGIVIGLVVISQLVIAFFTIYRFNQDTQRHSMVTLGELIDFSGFYQLLLIAAVGLLAIYSAYTWAREWLGGSTFIIRLLTLPGNRFVIVLAKWVSLLLMVGGVFFTQLLMVWAINFLGASFMNPGTYASIPWYYSYAQMLPMTQIFMPMTVGGSLLSFGAISLGVLIVFSVMVTLLFKQAESKVKAVLFAVAVGLANLLLLIVGGLILISLNLTVLESFVVVANVIVLGTLMNLFILLHQITFNPKEARI
ncbi:hypothetical protein ACTQ5J_12845 [Fundicoccus sp. Sow4_F4]|uniref:hypothetical protein n=1 Tax=Fundicoccus sp. Sow4_F4 TaxID=3438783 RepID=UPI003F920B70